MHTRFYVKGLALVGLVALLICGQSAFAATATGNANAQIITALSIAEATQLDFGMIAAGTNADTVQLSAAGVRTAGSNLQVAGVAAAAAFTVTGQGNLPYNITLPTLITVTLSGGGATMDVDGFASTPSGNGTLSAGTQTVNVGATLHVGASQAVGTYTGTYVLTAVYQ